MFIKAFRVRKQVPEGLQRRNSAMKFWSMAYSTQEGWFQRRNSDSTQEFNAEIQEFNAGMHFSTQKPDST